VAGSAGRQRTQSDPRQLERASRTPSSIEPTHIEIAGDLASDFGLVHFAPGAKPKDVKNTAKYLVVWKREHGTWKVFYDCWNWNAPEKDRQ
jgi:ketosteroid isomerase-like protein